MKRVHGGGKPDGEVSNLLCESYQVGDTVTMSLPFGGVVLDDSGRPVVFASAGIGVTPMAGMLSHLVAAWWQRGGSVVAAMVAAGSPLPVHFLHADLDEDSSSCGTRSSRTVGVSG